MGGSDGAEAAPPAVLHTAADAERLLVTPVSLLLRSETRLIESAAYPRHCERVLGLAFPKAEDVCLSGHIVATVRYGGGHAGNGGGGNAGSAPRGGGREQGAARGFAIREKLPHKRNAGGNRRGGTRERNEKGKQTDHTGEYNMQSEAEGRAKREKRARVTGKTSW